MIGISTLAHVHRVTTRAAGKPLELFVFDHHRGAFSLWALAAQELGSPLTLVTLDRHMDLERPKAEAPELAAGAEALDRFARELLSPRNDDHVVAALEAGAIGDALVVARSHQPPSLAAFAPYVDRRGKPHEFAFARTLDTLEADAYRLLERSEAIALDIDLDCFTTLSDGHLDEVLTWDEELIDAFLRPPDSEELWRLLLDRVALVTIAREPYHCGGFQRGAALWMSFARVFFGRLLGVPLP
jgi:hypothetical protein